MQHDTIIISKSHSILMNFFDFIKNRLLVKIPNITDLSNISFGTILTNIFAKQKSFLFSYCVNYDKKASEWYYLITGGENLQGQKLLIADETIIDCYL